jgi:YD repeat-containing protein
VTQTTRYQYDGDGNQTVVVDPLNKTSTTVFDALNRRVEVDEPLGKVTRSAYDPGDLLTLATDPLSHQSKYDYDALGRLTRTTDGLSLTPDGLTTTTNDTRSTTTFYDLVGNVTQVQDPAGKRTTFGLHTLYRRTAVTDPLGHVTLYQNDLLGHPVRVTDPEGSVTTLAYDGAYRQSSVTQGAQGPLLQPPQTPVTRDTVYNGRGKVVSVSMRNGATTQSSANYTYNGWDLPANIVDASGALTLQYDEAGNLTQTTNKAATPGPNVTAYSYDLLNRRTRAVDALSTPATFAYDLAGNLTSLTDRAGRRRDLAYDDLYRATQETWVAR